MRIDLHTHSRVSDGTDTPAELVRAARTAGLDVVALTDHDTSEGWKEALAAAEESGVVLVPGLEISTKDHRGWGIHLLAYHPDPGHPALAEELGRVLEGRNGRLPGMIERIRECGIDLSIEDVLAQSGDAAASGRPHVADALVAKGVVADRGEAFERYLAAGKPAYVDRYAAPLEKMIRLVKEAGGVSVVAHPWGRTLNHRPDAADFARWADAGLSGLEVDHQDHSATDRDRLRAIACELGLVVTGGSDYHGTGKVDHDLGVNTTDPAAYARLLAALPSGR